MAEGFIMASSAAPIKLRVLSSSGTCSVTMSVMGAAFRGLSRDVSPEF
jgi:hypothetical protein